MGGGGGKKNKTPSNFGPLPDATKRPRNVHAQQAEGGTPVWSLRLMDIEGPFGWRLEADLMHRIWGHLRDLENKTWHEITIVSKKQNHTIATEDLCKDARDRLVELGLDDQDEILSLRLSGKERIFGFRERGVLRLLWWDPDHKVCPANLKNT